MTLLPLLRSCTRDRANRLLWALPLLLAAGCATPPSRDGGPGDGPVPNTSTSAPAAPAPLPAAAVAAPTPSAPAIASADTMPVAAPIAIDPLQPGVRLDLDDRAARIDLWARVRAGFAMPDLESDLVRDSERWYAARPEYVQRMTERGGRYLFHIVEELDRRHMPTELALLPFIESAFNPQAMSTAKASGMWQFIPSTGRDFLLKQNLFRDDRRDVLASTRAALDYLQRLHGMFGDWQLALAAYNWGEGNVQRAIARNQKAGLPTDYASLKMPNETQLYVPKLQAVKNIVRRPADFGLKLPELSNHPYFLSVPIDRDIDVALAVQLAGMSLEEFQTLNPQMNKPVILASGTPQVLLPYDNANQFVRRLPRHRGPLATWTAWVAPRTMRTADAAHEIGMAEAELREINRIPARMLVKAGSTLLVPRADSRVADVSSHVADNAMMSLAPDAPPLQRLSLRAGRRDSVASVAQRYKVSASQVAEWNSTNPAAAFRPGQAIFVFVAAKARVAHAARGPRATRVGTRVVAATRVSRPAPSAHRAHATHTARPPHKPVRLAHN